MRFSLEQMVFAVHFAFEGIMGALFAVDTNPSRLLLSFSFVVISDHADHSTLPEQENKQPKLKTSIFFP
jgi:hypothetical protein